jgi:hypothetical protein
MPFTKEFHRITVGQKEGVRLAQGQVINLGQCIAKAGEGLLRALKDL